MARVDGGSDSGGEYSILGFWTLAKQESIVR